jgi:hypoxanthine phosphoribosyltransferase
MKSRILMLLSLCSCCFAQEESLDLLIAPHEINQKIMEVGELIDVDYADKPLTIVMVMKGSVTVTADLIRHIHVPFKLEYVKASSYGYNGTTAGEMTIEGFDRLDIEGRDVLLVDDIFETGNTIQNVKAQLLKKNPSSIKTLLLLVKDVPRNTSYRPDYVLFDIPDRFVIGYGLDYKELYRGLPGIYAFPNDLPPF